MLRWLVILVIVLFPFTGFAQEFAQACNCKNQLKEISKEQTDQYDVVFHGYIKQLIHQDKEDYAEFVVSTPYKGLVPRDIKIFYDSRTSCQMPFFPGDEWLIYAKKDSAHKRWTVDYCERSRKFPEGDDMDYYTVYSGNTLQEELDFLEINYSNGQIVGEDTLTMIEEKDIKVIDAHRADNYGTPREKIILLICSLAGMIVIYFIMRLLLGKKK
jgi:hypothetical protein